MLSKPYSSISVVLMLNTVIETVCTTCNIIMCTTPIWVLLVILSCRCLCVSILIFSSCLLSNNGVMKYFKSDWENIMTWRRNIDEILKKKIYVEIRLKRMTVLFELRPLSNGKNSVAKWLKRCFTNNKCRIIFLCWRNSLLHSNNELFRSSLF